MSTNKGLTGMAFGKSVSWGLPWVVLYRNEVSLAFLGYHFNQTTISWSFFILRPLFESSEIRQGQLVLVSKQNLKSISFYQIKKFHITQTTRQLS